MIDKDIPIPHELISPVSGKYPWRACTEVGDSFLSDESFKVVQAAMRKFTQRNREYDFVMKEMDDGKVRVWRVR